jgi:hypothetical protein
MQKRPPLMQGHEYPLEKLLPLLMARGAGDFHLRIDETSEGHVFAFIFCKKSDLPLPDRSKR